MQALMKVAAYDVDSVDHKGSTYLKFTNRASGHTRMTHPDEMDRRFGHHKPGTYGVYDLHHMKTKSGKPMRAELSERDAFKIHSMKGSDISHVHPDEASKHWKARAAQHKAKRKKPQPARTGRG